MQFLIQFMQRLSSLYVTEIINIFYYLTVDTYLPYFNVGGKYISIPFKILLLQYYNSKVTIYLV